LAAMLLDVTLYYYKTWQMCKVGMNLDEKIVVLLI